jgi:hypothetical protein
MLNRAFGGLKRSLFDDRGVERSPANVFTMSDETVTGPEYAAMRFPNGKYRAGRHGHDRHYITNA